MLRDLTGTVVVVVRKMLWLGVGAAAGGPQSQLRDEVEPEAPVTPRSSMRRLV